MSTRSCVCVYVLQKITSKHFDDEIPKQLLSLIWLIIIPYGG